mmetsp:Transcript_15210/g.25737  ORF Transcript_15210/g.25737 Transcript_15210/m.25737 type:complete len:271 (-) Transcript_15210:769-1581(-)
MAHCRAGQEEAQAGGLYVATDDGERGTAAAHFVPLPSHFALKLPLTGLLSALRLQPLGPASGPCGGPGRVPGDSGGRAWRVRLQRRRVLLQAAVHAGRGHLRGASAGPPQQASPSRAAVRDAGPARPPVCVRVPHDAHRSRDLGAPAARVQQGPGGGGGQHPAAGLVHAPRIRRPVHRVRGDGLFEVPAQAGEALWVYTSSRLAPFLRAARHDTWRPLWEAPGGHFDPAGTCRGAPGGESQHGRFTPGERNASGGGEDRERAAQQRQRVE